jgi:hypothetical protein
MIDEMQQLEAVLQMLALPVTGQVRLVPDDCNRVAALTEAFHAMHRAVLSSRGGELLPEQAHALIRLDARLDRLRLESSPPLCSELGLRASSDWRQVRVTAREALIAFRWTLALPSQDILSAHARLN